MRQIFVIFFIFDQLLRTDVVFRCVISLPMVVILFSRAKPFGQF